jgi:hypothetical protein
VVAQHSAAALQALADVRLAPSDLHPNRPSGLFIAGDEGFFTFTQSFDLPPR